MEIGSVIFWQNSMYLVHERLVLLFLTEYNAFFPSAILYMPKLFFFPAIHLGVYQKYCIVHNIIFFLHHWKQHRIKINRLDWSLQDKFGAAISNRCITCNENIVLCPWHLTCSISILCPISEATIHLFVSRNSAIQSLKTGNMATNSLTTWNGDIIIFFSDICLSILSLSLFIHRFLRNLHVRLQPKR